ATDAVLDVNDEIADVQRAKVLDERSRGLARLLLSAAMDPPAEDLLLGDDDPALAGEDDPAGERTDDDVGERVVARRPPLAEPRRVERRCAYARHDVLVAEQHGEALGLG